MGFRCFFLSVFVLVFVAACGSGSSTPPENLQQARQAHGAGKIKESIIFLKTALQGDADYLEAHLLLGEVYMDAGDYASAEKHLLRAGGLGGDANVIKPLLAHALLKQNRQDEVLAMEVAELYPIPRAQVLSVQGRMSLALNDVPAAERYIGEAASLAPGLEAVRTEQARMLIIKGDVAGAREVLRELLDSHPDHATAWSLLGDLERSEGNGDVAIAAFGKAIASQRDNAADRLKRAFLHIEQGRLDLAQEDVDQFKKRHPDYHEAHFAQGLIHFQKQQFQEALPEFERAIRGAERYMQAVFYRGLTYRVLGRNESAKTDLLMFVANSRGNVLGYKVLGELHLADREFAKAEELLRPLSVALPDDPVVLKLYGMSLAGLSRMDEALPHFEKLAALEPDNLAHRIVLASALIASGKDVARGIGELHLVLEGDPGNTSAHEALIRSYLNKGDHDAALEQAELFRRQLPDQPQPLNMLGATYLAMNQSDKANQAFDEARKLVPGDIFANKYLAMNAVHNNDFGLARDRYREILKYHQNNLDALMNLSILAELSGDKEEIIRLLHQAIDAYPEQVQPRTSLARLYLVEGKPDKAEAALGEILALHGNDPGLLDVLGRIRLAQADGVSARTAFNRLVGLKPDSSEAHFMLGNAHLRAGDLPEARKSLVEAVRLNEQHFMARLVLGRLLMTERDIPGAEAQLAALKQMDGDDPDVVMLEAALASSAGDHEKGHDLYEKVFGTLGTGTSLRALVQQKWELGDVAGAVLLLERWLGDNPRDAQARLRLANAYERQGDDAQAIKQYESVLEQDERNVVALNNLAWKLKDADIARGLKYAEKAHQLAPASAEIADTYGFLLYRNGNLELAQRVNLRAMELNPGHPTIRFHNALIENALGNRAGAIRVLQALLGEKAAFPEKQEAQALLDRLARSE